MKRLPSLLLLSLLAVGTAHYGVAQSKTAPPSAAIATNSTDRFLMRQGTVVYLQGNNSISLTKNVVLANGTKINYNDGVVELMDGKKTTLQEGDYVRINGDIVSTPVVNTLIVRDNPAPTSAKTGERSTSGSSKGKTNLAPNEASVLLSRKVQLLNQKINLMMPNSANQEAIKRLNQQLITLDAQLNH